MSDDDRLSDIDRRSLRILARSSKSSVSGARLSERLERAADSGLRLDYQKAEQTFDSLPAEDRLMISAKAEKQAATERDLLDRRKHVASSRNGAAHPTNGKPAADDEPLQWKPIFEAAASDTPPPPPKPARAVKKTAPEDEDEDGMAWKLGAASGNAKTPSAGFAAKPAAAKPVPQPVDDWEDDQKDWNWRDIPDDPVMNGGKKKTAVDPIEELRRQMLGLDAKYGKR